MLNLLKQSWTTKLGALAFVAILMTPTIGNSAVFTDATDSVLYGAFGPDNPFPSGIAANDSKYYALPNYLANDWLPSGSALTPNLTVTTNTTGWGSTLNDGENKWLQSRYGTEPSLKSFVDSQSPTPDVRDGMQSWFYDIDLVYKPNSSCGGCGDFQQGQGSDTFTINMNEIDNVNFVFVHMGSEFIAYMFNPNAPLKTFSITGLDNVSNIYAYDWPVTTVPLPAALPLYGTGLALMGFVGWRKRRKAAQA